MKALSLHEPWASLVRERAKTIETRSWQTRYRGPLAIHAAQTLKSVEYLAWQAEHDGDGAHPALQPFADRIVTALSSRGYTTITRHPFPTGCVVATCELVDVVPIEVVLPKADRAPGVPAYSSGYDKVTVHPLAHGGKELHHFVGTNGRDITDQLPYGDFRPGRYAWVLDNIEPLEHPIPVTGKQGLWEWDEAEWRHLVAEA